MRARASNVGITSATVIYLSLARFLDPSNRPAFPYPRPAAVATFRSPIRSGFPCRPIGGIMGDATPAADIPSALTAGTSTTATCTSALLRAVSVVRLHDTTQIGAGRPAAPMCSRQKAPDQPPFRIGHITCITQFVPTILLPSDLVQGIAISFESSQIRWNHTPLGSLTPFFSQALRSASRHISRASVVPRAPKASVGLPLISSVKT
jgi:hypothetical protein